MNRDPAFFDLGLCGPKRQDLTARRELCGAFKVPTLRNVARTAPYFHNGSFATLREVVDFYVRRDTQPEDWYPHGAGRVEKFNDLPPDLRRNVNVDGYLTTASPVRLPRFRRLKSTTWSLS